METKVNKIAKNIILEGCKQLINEQVDHIKRNVNDISFNGYSDKLSESQIKAINKVKQAIHEAYELSITYSKLQEVKNEFLKVKGLSGNEGDGE